MSTFTKAKNSVLAVLALAAAAAAILVGAGFVGSSSSSPNRPAPMPKPRLNGPWQYIADAPQPVAAGRTTVWTGTELIVAGTNPGSDGTFVDSTEVAEAYNPAANTWRMLPTPPSTENICRRSAVWTGKEMLVWGCSLLAFDPAKNEWRKLPDPPTRQGIVAWTGHELIGWGGGCCGDVSDDGSAYDPETNTWRMLAQSPVGGQQSPAGAWTGHELVILSGSSPDGKPVAGAAYDPASDTWRRIPSVPAPYAAAQALSSGGKVYAVGRGDAATSLLELDLERDAWKDLGFVAQAPGPAIMAGNQLVMLGGEGYRAAGLSYYFETGATVPFVVPRLARGIDPALVWTGHRVLVWGGTIPTRANASNPPHYLASGLAFRPRKVSPPLPQCGCGG
jgi:hypothetical protein